MLIKIQLVDLKKWWMGTWPEELLGFSNIVQVGTVLNIKDAKNAVKAGAKFLMSPTMVKVCVEIGPVYHIYFCLCVAVNFKFIRWNLASFFMFYFYRDFSSFGSQTKGDYKDIFFIQTISTDCRVSSWVILKTNSYIYLVWWPRQK